MTEYIFDFILVSALIIGLTALNGVITNFIGENLFGRKNKHVFKDATAKTQQGWKRIQ